MFPNIFTARVGEFSEMRSCPLGEKGGSSASGPKSGNKRKESSMGEEIYSKAGSAWRHKRDTTIEVDHVPIGLEGVAPLLPPSSSLVEGTSRDKDHSLLSCPPVKGTLRDTGFLSLSSSPVEGTSRDV